MSVQKTDVVQGQTSFHQMPWRWSALCASLCLSLPSPTWKINTPTSITKCIQEEICIIQWFQVSTRSWPSVNLFMARLTRVLLFYGCFPLGLCYWPLFVALFGCPFSCWMTDQVQWSVQRTCRGLELKPISAVLQSQKLPIPPWGDGSLRGGGCVTSSSSYTSTSPLDLSLIEKIRLQQDVVKS